MPQAAAAPAVATPIPPLIHAVAGSLGGALALLLFYPLERARIDMQKTMSSSSSHHHQHPTTTSTSATPTWKTPQHRPSVLSSSKQQDDDSSRSSLERRRDGPSLSPPTPPLLGGSWALDDSRDTKDKDDDLVLVENALPTTTTTTTTRPQQQQHHHHHPHSISLSTCIRSLWERHELYRGVSPVVLTLAASNFVFFYVHEAMKRIIVPTTTAKTIQSSSSSSSYTTTSYRSLLASCLAGICNVLLTNPLWVANLRIATGESQYKSLVAEMRYVAHQLGWSHLWSGTGASLLLVSNPVLQFFWYEQLKRLLASTAKNVPTHSTTTTTTAMRMRMTPMHAFVAGALAKTIATLLTYPLQLAQTLLRMQQNDSNNNNNNNKDCEPNNSNNNKNDNEYYRGTWDCLRQLYGQDGPLALFTGMRAKLLQTVLTAAFTFLTYEQIAVALHHATCHHLQSQPSPRSAPRSPQRPRQRE